MNTTNNKTKSLSSSSAFIIIMVLVVVSVAAVIVGGGDGFSRKYAGIRLQEFINSNFLLAQAGTVGKTYELEEDTSSPTGLRARIKNIVLDESLLPNTNSRFASALVPEYFDNTLWHTKDIESQVLAGYPLAPSFVADNALLSKGLTDGNFPAETPGFVECSPTGNGMKAFFEDIAYGTKVGFDDPTHGTVYQNTVCSVFNEFTQILSIPNNVSPTIVFQKSTDGTPSGSLSVVAPQFSGGSGWKSTILADYIRSGEDVTPNIISDSLSVVGSEGFIRVNFKDVEWMEATNSDDAYSLTTVLRRNMLNLLGFGVSFVDNNGVNAIQSAQARWTNWDQLMFRNNGEEQLVDNLNLIYNTFQNLDSNYSEISNVNERDSFLTTGDAILSGFNLIDAYLYSSAENIYNIFTPSTWVKGQSLSGLADANAVSNPILEKGQVRTLSNAEKQILCHMGLSAEPTSAGDGACEYPRSVVSDTIIYRNNNLPVCVNLFDENTVKNAKTNNFKLAGEMISDPGQITIDPLKFKMITQECPEGDINENIFNGLSQVFGTNTPASAKAFMWKPTGVEGPLKNRELVTFSYAIADQTHGRISDPVDITISKNIINLDSNLIKNPGFQDFRADSPLDLTPLSLSQREDGSIECLFASVSAWCTQGVASVVSEALGTWNPFLIKPIDADPTSEGDEGTPKAYASVLSGWFIQKLNSPLLQGTSYTVSGKYYVENPDIIPQFIYSGTTNGKTGIRKQVSGAYHIDYPELLATDGPVPVKISLPTPPTVGEWHTFSFDFNPGDQNVTHIAFGSNSNLGRVLFDDLSMTTLPPCADLCPGDLNGDCTVSFADMTAFLSKFGQTCPNDGVGCQGDFNTDGLISFADMTGFLALYGTSCPPNGSTAMNLNGEDANNSMVASAGKTKFAQFFNGLFAKNSEGKLVAAQARSSRNSRPSSNTRYANSEATLKDGVVVIPNDKNDEVSLSDFSILYSLSEDLKTIPNANGFKANLNVDIRNTSNKRLNNINFIGLVPPVFTVRDVRFSDPDVSINSSTGTLYVPDVPRSSRDTLSVYAKVMFNDNLCAQIRREEGQVYTKLVEVNLCESPQLLLERQSGIMRDEKGNIIPPRRGGSRSSDVLGGLPQCNDGLDNDADGVTDDDDPDCHTDGNSRNPASYDGTRTESGTIGVPQCMDGIDNDGDTKIDLNDPGCNNVFGNNEASR